MTLPEAQTGARHGDQDVAIVGLSVCVPGAPDYRAFWRNLREGRESIRRIEREALRAAGVTETEAADPRYVPASAHLDAMEDFDPEFFGFSPKEAAILDPQHRHFLERCWEALEDAAHPPERFSGPIGVYAGCGMGTYFARNLLSNPELVRSVGLFLLRHTGNDKDFLTTRASYCLDLTGPSVGIQTACSTSLVAVHMACQSLLARECDMALAGGVTIELPHGCGYAHEQGGILSSDGHCRAFDARASGTVFGSGSGVVVLRRLADALTDRDHVYAVIRGTAVNNDGARKVGYLAPSVDRQAAAVTEALAVSGARASELGYVECHGTATPVGDPIEIAALTAAFRRTSGRSAYCGVGSVKSNIGHLDTAAGIASLAKVALSLRHGEIPPSLHYQSPNPAIAFDDSPFFVDAQLRRWDPDAPAIAGVNSLGVGGTNAFAVVERAPARSPSPPARRRAQLLVVSGRSRAALDANAGRLAEHLRAEPDLPLADVAWTLAVGRRAFRHRRALAAASVQEAIALLEKPDPRRAAAHVAADDAPPVCFLLPGGGAQYPRMAAELLDTEPIFREHVERGLAWLSGQLDGDLRHTWFGDGDAAWATAEFHRPSLQLPAIFLTEYALAKTWESYGVSPKAMLGHSLGENTAACLAGVFTFEEALGLVALRGRLFERVADGAMLAVPLSEEALRPLLGDALDLGVVNGPELCVVSGPADEVARCESALAARGIEAKRVPISLAAHSRMLAPILSPFGDYLRSLRLLPPKVPFLSNVTGDWITDAQATDPAYWVRHLHHTVQFASGAERLLAVRDAIFLEVGPGRTLGALLKQQRGYDPARAVIPSLPHPDEPGDAESFFLGAYGQLWACGRELDPGRLWPAEQRQRLALPTYAFQRKRYWIEPGAGAGPGATPEDARLEPLEAWGFAHAFEPVAPADARIVGKHTWLLFFDQDGVGAGLAQELRSAGQEVIEVHEADGYAQTSANRYTLSPEQGREGYDSLVRDLAASGKMPEYLVHLWLVTAVERFRPGSSFFHRNLACGFSSLFFLAQAFGAEGGSGPQHWIVAGNEILRAAPGDLLRPEKAMALGPCRVLSREFPGTTCAVLDLPLPCRGVGSRTRRRSLAAAVADAAKVLAEECAQPPGDVVLAQRGRTRLRRVVRPRPLPSAAPAAWREGGVYLITGGFGGIGAAVARRLARAAHARLVLVGRTRLPPPAERDAWLRQHGEADPISRRILLVRELEAAGAAVMDAAVDVADLIGMREAVAAAKQRFGPLDGVFHAAGLIRDEPILTKSLAQIEDVFGAKVHGTQVLAVLREEENFPLLVLFSSASTEIAPPGQSDYVAANAYLEAFAEQESGDPHRRVLAITWGLWRDDGMAARAAAGLSETGVHSAETREAAAHPLLDVRVQVDGQPAWFESVLGPDTHWLLDEHRTLEGHALAPGTGFLELARAALAELGEDGPFELRDLFFLRPLHVADGATRLVRINVSPTEEGFGFEVLGRCELHDGRRGWEAIAQARLLLHPLQTPSQIRLDEISARCGEPRSAPSGATLRLPQERALRFGSRWRSLRSVASGAGESLARIEFPLVHASELADYRLHPAMLDVAAGFAMDLISGYAESDGLWVPFAYRRMRAYSALPREIWSYVRTAEETRADADVAVFDVTLCDDTGNVLLEIERLALKRLAGGGSLAVARLPLPSELRLDERPSVDAPRATTAGTLMHIASGIGSEEGVDALERALAEAGTAVRGISSIDVNLLAAEATLAAAGPGHDGARFGRPQLTSEFVEPRDALEKMLAGFWEELLGVDRVGIEDDFFELGGHSLIAVRLFARIRNACQVDLPISVLFEAPTVARCADLLRERIGGDALAARGERPRRRYTYLVPMSQADHSDRLPFFLVAGMFGNVLNLRHLAHLVGADRPFYGLQARGLYGDQQPHETFESMARDYIAEMRTVQPNGPYLLGGFSGGGITAFEMAHQLFAEGEQIGLLAFLDTPLPTSPPLSSVDKISIHLQRLQREGLGYLPAWLRKRIHWTMRHFHRAGPDSAVEGPAHFRSLEIEAAFRRALDYYVLHPYPGTVTLFRPKLDEAYRLSGGRMASESRELVWSDNGWTPHVDGIRVFEVPGDHDSMVLEPNVRVLAARLRSCILEAEASARA